MNPAIAFIVYFAITFVVCFILLFAVRGLLKFIQKSHEQKERVVSSDAQVGRPTELESFTQESIKARGWEYKQTNRLVGVEIRSSTPQKLGIKVELVRLTESGQDEPIIKDANFHEFRRGKFTERGAILNDDPIIIYLAETDSEGSVDFDIDDEPLRVLDGTLLDVMVAGLIRKDYFVKINMIMYTDNHRVSIPFSAAIHFVKEHGTWAETIDGQIKMIPPEPTSLHIEEIQETQHKPEPVIPVT